MTNLGTLPGSTGSWAQDINDSGLIVGYSVFSGAGRRAMVYSEGVMSDLNDLVSLPSGWVLREATAVNNNGDIVGYGEVDGQTRAFLLTFDAVPVPEPSSLALMGLGLAVFAGRKLRRRRSISRQTAA